MTMDVEPGDLEGPGSDPGLLAGLLRDVAQLRRLLQVDLALVASATELGALSVAAEVVHAGCDELAGFSQRTQRDLAAG